MADSAPNRGLLIALAYLWVLAFIPLVAAADEDVRWHARHGLVLAAAEFLLFVGYIILATLLGMATLGLGFALMLVLPLAMIGVLALHAIAIVKGMNGTRLNVPGVSGLANRF